MSSNNCPECVWFSEEEDCDDGPNRSFTSFFCEKGEDVYTHKKENQNSCRKFQPHVKKLCVTLNSSITFIRNKKGAWSFQGMVWCGLTQMRMCLRSRYHPGSQSL